MKNLLLIVTLIALAACNAAKKAATKPPPVVDTTTASPKAKETPADIVSNLNHIDFKTFSGRVDIDYDDDKGNGVNANAKLVMIKDKAIWLSAGKLGFEGVRALITPDSVKIINKLKKEYIAQSLAYIQEKIGLPVDFNTLQDLLIGNAVFISKDNATFTQNGSNYLLSTQDAHFKNLLTVLMPGYLPTLSNLTDADSTKNRDAQLSYGDYKNAAGRNFPNARSINVNYKGKKIIKLNFRSADFDGDVSTPFSVPSGYETKQ